MIAQLQERLFSSHQRSAYRSRLEGKSGCRPLAHRRDKLVTASWHRLNISRGLRVIPQDLSDLVQLGLHRLGLNIEFRPHGSKNLFLRDQPPCVLNKMAQQGKGLGRQPNALVLTAFRAAPKTLVGGVEPKCQEFDHRRDAPTLKRTPREHTPTATPAAVTS